MKGKGKNKFNGIVKSIKTCVPYATICAQGGWVLHPLGHEN